MTSSQRQDLRAEIPVPTGIPDIGNVATLRPDRSQDRPQRSDDGRAAGRANAGESRVSPCRVRSQAPAGGRSGRTGRAGHGSLSMRKPVSDSALLGLDSVP
ncbi:hypothetical protein GCM10027079_14270 [Sediminivirga luteola]|uniref:Uncharacterized protein n=1 Tax=Sediminivirga luteola TaxID=1774748 RepID=A0A8J2TV37_9MICO|nr:hypothetical protein GCM10011333_01720 [Sediminivirga luteola]